MPLTSKALLLQNTLKSSLGKISGTRRAIMFSGGFDSMLLSRLISRWRARVTAVTIKFEDFNPRTVSEATLLAQKMNLDHQIINVTLLEFLSSFESVSSLIHKPLVDLDLAVVHAALKKYNKRRDGKVLVSAMGCDQWLGEDVLNQALMDTDAHDKVAAAYGLSFSFPFLSREMRDLSKEIPDSLKKNKKLLRSLMTAKDLQLLPKKTSSREIQVPDEVRRLLIKLYAQSRKGRVATQSLHQIAQRLGGKHQTHRLFK